MGLCLSAEEIEQKEISQNIDRGLEEDNRRLKKECKILLLGKLPMIELSSMERGPTRFPSLSLSLSLSISPLSQLKLFSINMPPCYIINLDLQKN
jgi:hypothetical protein